MISLQHGGWNGFEAGTLFILGAAICQALYFIIIKPLLTRYHPLDVTSYVIWFGLLFLLPFHDGIIERLHESSREVRAAVVFLGVGPAALAYIAWSYVLQNMAAGRAASLLYFIPVVAIILAWVVLGEWPALMAILGGALAIGGVILSRKTAPGNFHNR